MMPARMKAWETRIKTAIRTRNDEALRQALHSLRQIPGFWEIRDQAFELAKLLKKEWKRSRRGDFPWELEVWTISLVVKKNRIRCPIHRMWCLL